jgi:hypothetical protein
MHPTLLGFVLLLVGLFVPKRGKLHFAVICSLFAGGAAAIVSALGGANITPTMLALMFLGFSFLRHEGVWGFFKPIRFGGDSFWLVMLAGWGIFSAFFLPRFFQNAFMVSSFDRVTGAQGLMPLRPLSMNITQAMYLFVALVTFLMFRKLLEDPENRRRLCRAILWAAGLNVCFGLLDLASSYIGIFPVLSLVKNGNYAILGGDVAGLARITGTFPEASSFAQYTLGLIGFTHVLWIRGVYRKPAMWLTLFNIALLLLSTSGTAYVGLAICLLLGVIYSLYKFAFEGAIGEEKIYLYFLGFGIFASIAVVLFVPSALDKVSEYFGTVIGRKMSSDSGRIRMLANELALQAFLDSYGLGAGLGSARASSFVMVLLSNLGWIGTFLFVAFVRPIMWATKRPSDSFDDAFITAARRAIFANLVSACLVGLTFDLGAMFYILAAAVFSWPTKREQSMSNRPDPTLLSRTPALSSKAL